MNEADKKAVERAKSGNGSKPAREQATKPEAKNSVQAGANRIVDFINTASDKASDQVADAITAATIQKAMFKLGQGDGALTDQAIATFEAAWTEVMVENLPALTGSTQEEVNPKFYLPSSSSFQSGGGQGECAN